MKKYMKHILSLSIILMFIASVFAEEKLPPYFRIASVNATIPEMTKQVKAALASENFEVIGEYSPASNADLYVLAFTRADLQSVCLKVKDRGMLASVLKIGFVRKEGKTIISMLNPMYLFYAYLMDEADTFNAELAKISGDVKKSMSTIGNEISGFGGGESDEDLKDYHYMMMMPYFTDKVELKEFDSFDKGVNTIRENLKVKRGNTVKVYELVLENEKIAVFGIGLLDPEEGEAHFLPIIGEDNIAALPYEIILQVNNATMLPGKYRFALHWPELSMKQFMKISSTPGDVEDFMEGLTEQ